MIGLSLSGLSSLAALASDHAENWCRAEGAARPLPPALSQPHSIDPRETGVGCLLANVPGHLGDAVLPAGQILQFLLNLLVASLLAGRLANARHRSLLALVALAVQRRPVVHAP